MDSIDAKIQADLMRRHRLVPFHFQQTDEYRGWSEQMKHDYQERLGMIVGADTITAEAHVIAYHQIVGGP